MSLSGPSIFIPNGPLIPSDSLSSKSKINGIAYPVTKFVLPSYPTSDDVVDPIIGMLIFNNGTKKLNFYTGTSWEEITST